MLTTIRFNRGTQESQVNLLKQQPPSQLHHT